MFFSLNSNFSRNNYIVPSFNLTKIIYRIAIPFPKLGNNILNKEEKPIENPTFFKTTAKAKIKIVDFQRLRS